LLNEVLRYLKPQPGESYLDLTAGYGGHAAAITQRTDAVSKAVLVDRDEAAAKHLKQKFASAGSRVIRSDFLSASQQLVQAKERFDLILADLGLSSPHLDDASRGFAFSRSGPLDMRMDQSQPLTAAEIVNSWSQDKLEELFRRFGEEPKARQIAISIVLSRPIETTDQLAKVVNSVKGLRRQRINRSTKIFQALRIAVNDELRQLEIALPLWLELLSPGGRMAIISFHSLEDRLVKRFLLEHGGRTYDAELKLLTKKPILANREEIDSNPRARSAKLRAAAKIKTKRKEEGQLNADYGQE
jgi:16S rRNA (cytosine1402-N4)-methyltransferase